MKFKFCKKNAVFLQIIGSVFYIILIFSAMIFYTGGTQDNPSIPGYSFWANTLSDSGRTIAYSGVPNIISMVIFSAALIIYAILFIPFYLKISDLFKESKSEKNFSKIGTILGIVSSITFIGIAFTPADILIGPHMLFVYIGYASIFFNAICYSIAMYMNKDFPKIYAIILIVFGLLYFITLLMGLIGLASDRNLMVIGQKIGRFASLGTFFILAYGIWKFEKS
ncbi:MAG: hypothetical protein KGD73_09605 [Candidatus Lokiarchaeota archaeon]|nr:hypothetical protein [Candidatus Lokiarchaeota archaeon]